MEWQDISPVIVNREEPKSRLNQRSHTNQLSQQHQVRWDSESESEMRQQDLHWYGTFNAEEAFFTSLCIAIHSGGIRRDIMATRTTKGGLSWRARCGQDTNFTGSLPGSVRILSLVTNDDVSAIFQTWFFWNSRSDGQTLSLSKLLSLRHYDSRTYCSRCATTGQ